ncbi:MOSC domain-containing protein [Saccharothrix violaceirubra]|uniref:MOSC domain-containing protein YiiM n=1 Tax=Saccharothrix violaceirubra TaxID=413306 RepID=A0A7W7T1F2_9PSEU|nr:MOSC domain-containing protein [Saccharothrix violaceirubra]MBB4964511.1 MOSC domain-containing protein YiiM [Saccharothrix violaceirubra]
MASVLSLNVAERVEFPVVFGSTGIHKRPVEGRVAVRAPGPSGTGGSGIVGDHVADLRVHGGDDKAVYAYAREDLDDWAAELGRDLPAGLFGENLTTLGVSLTEARIGERWRIGSAVLRVAGPRVPCRTFALVMDEPGWAKRFIARAVPGAYFAVAEPGELGTGDAIEVEHRPDHDVTIGLAFRAVTLEPDLLPRLLAAGDDLPARVRERVERRATYSPES